MASQANLPFPVNLMSVGGLVAVPNTTRRNRLLRLIQSIRNLERPNHGDLVEALNFYNAKDRHTVSTGVYGYTHQIIDVPWTTQPGTKIRIPRTVARDISLPWILLSRTPRRTDAGLHVPKYRYLFFIYRHRPTLTYNPDLLSHREAPDLVYTMSYWDRENPANMTWIDFKDRPAADTQARLDTVQLYWANARLIPERGELPDWWVDPMLYLNFVGHSITTPWIPNNAWAGLELYQTGEVLRQLTLYAVMAHIIYMLNQIYSHPNAQAGTITVTPMPVDDLDHLSGMHPHLLPELFWATVHILKANPVALYSENSVKNRANLAVIDAKGISHFGLLDKEWVEQHIRVSREPKLRYWRHKVKLALENHPNRVAAVGTVSGIDQFPWWYTISLV